MMPSIPKEQFDFSKVSKEYAKYRPSYPAELFQYLASLTPERKCAWDCGTGSGQAAWGLVEYFEQIIATDQSQAQMDQARPHPKIQYRQLPAERTDFPDQSMDLVTVGQAVHWFDLDLFFAEVKRVLKPEGVIAIWCYERLWTSIDAINAILEHYAKALVGPFWPAETHWVWQQYKTLPFPFAEIKAPHFEVTLDCNLQALLGYLSSWSATQKYAEIKRENPMALIMADLKKAWGDEKMVRTLRWDLHLRVGLV